MKTENILLLHGALGTKAQLEPLANLLTNNFNLYSLNFEGHGDRKSDNDFSIGLFASNVESYLKEHRISKTHIFGYSMGGYVALKLALQQPDLVGKIVTLGTKFNWTPEVSAQEIRKLNPDKIEEKVPAFANRLEALHSENNWKDVMKKTAKMMIDLGAGQKLTNDDLKNISHEVLIGIGEMDEMVTLEESRHSAGLLANSRLEVIDGFRHPIEKVDMDKLAEIITRNCSN